MTQPIAHENLCALADQHVYGLLLLAVDDQITAARDGPGGVWNVMYCNA